VGSPGGVDHVRARRRLAAPSKPIPRSAIDHVPASARPITHPPLLDVAVGLVTQCCPSHSAPGAQSSVVAHAVAQAPVVSHRYGGQLWVFPSVEVDVRPSALQRAPSAQEPATQAKPVAQSSFVAQLVLQARRAASHA
jgi:hypothetical protein